jgi:hypothetical protein
VEAGRGAEQRGAGQAEAGPGGKRLRGGYRQVLGAVLRRVKTHPELIVRNDALLWSINERLGGLCRAQGALPVPGQDLTPLGRRWLADLLALDAEEDPGDEDDELLDALEELD